MLEEARWVRGKVHMPRFADEACQRAADIPKLKECFDGVNVKLDKSGGILEAYRMLQNAAALIQLDVHAVEAFLEFGDVGCALTGLVGKSRHVHFAAHPPGLLQH